MSEGVSMSKYLLMACLGSRKNLAGKKDGWSHGEQELHKTCCQGKYE